MVGNLGDYWWILALLAYCVLLVVLVRRGTWARHGPKIVLTVNCAIILTIPFMDRPYGYIAAALVVVSLLLRETNSDLPLPRLGGRGSRSPSHRREPPNS